MGTLPAKAGIVCLEIIKERIPGAVGSLSGEVIIIIANI